MSFCVFQANRSPEPHDRLGDMIEERGQLLTVDCALAMDVIEVKNEFHLQQNPNAYKKKNKKCRRVSAVTPYPSHVFEEYYGSEEDSSRT